MTARTVLFLGQSTGQIFCDVTLNCPLNTASASILNAKLGQLTKTSIKCTMMYTVEWLKAELQLNRPNYLIFVDETGDDTSQKHDGNQGSEKLVVGVKERALLSSSFDGCHWTSLGFTLGDGRPLLCVIIIADILKYIDSFDIFDRTEAIPFLLLDGHGSRFGLCFLEYVNPPPPPPEEKDHSCTASIGTPYATNLWQVADRKEQNGKHKNETKAEKRIVIYKKGQLGLPMRVERHDIVGLVHRAWLKSFTNIETNKQAVADRGWNLECFPWKKRTSTCKKALQKHSLTR